MPGFSCQTKYLMMSGTLIGCWERRCLVRTPFLLWLNDEVGQKSYLELARDRPNLRGQASVEEVDHTFLAARSPYICWILMLRQIRSSTRGTADAGPAWMLVTYWFQSCMRAQITRSFIFPSFPRKKKSTHQPWRVFAWTNGGPFGPARCR